MRLTICFFAALLLCATIAVAQIPADKVKPIRRLGRTEVLFYWQQAECATAYRLIAKAYQSNTKKYAGKLTIAETTDSFVRADLDSHRQKLDAYEAKYKARKKRCAADTACKLNYNYYLVIVKGRKKSKPIAFSMLWDK